MHRVYSLVVDHEQTDVLIVGAGISGIGAAYHLQRQCPDRRYLIVEGRAAMGGTWDLFRYPGVRSDSDMQTLGYAFRPWRGRSSIAAGEDILEYLHATAAEHGIDDKIRYGHWVSGASWSSDAVRWSVDIERAEPRPGESRALRVECKWLFICTGYYDYEAGYTPDFEGVEDFTGRVVHPQFWTDDIDYREKRVVVIGSGATAVTLVPALAQQAAKVTMLQRSPTYYISMPAVDPIAKALERLLPSDVAYRLARWKNIVMSYAMWKFCRTFPERARALLMRGVRERVGEVLDVDVHFNPHYAPWDQRLCLVPDDDLFRAIRSGKAEVVTDHVERFTPRGIKLRGGDELEADLIVTATGLSLKFLGGIALRVDGKPVEANDTWVYRGMMLSDVPNLSFATGYTNSSWTLKVDLTCSAVARLLDHMQSKGYTVAVPPRDDSLEQAPLLNLSSGYIARAVDRFPKQSTTDPWFVPQNYLRDLFTLKLARVEDGTLRFSRREPAARRQAPVWPVKASA
ncbi:MAG: NAD(P)/FAD-dependent oxidoreductase [Myxococcales bacterium]|nr:NAD(P)/FAD-dependent oxidoreductase [Myxococcales bacterium]